jgi:hypothetical protein
LKDLHVKLLALGLTILGITLCYYKVTWLGLPLWPTKQAEVWTIEARIEFRAKKRKPVKVQFCIPHLPPGFTVVDEDFVSSNYGLTTQDYGPYRLAQWAVRQVSGDQALYYRIQLAPDAKAVRTSDASPPVLAEAPELADLTRSAVATLLREVQSRSADTVSFTRELLGRLNAPVADGHILLLRREVETPQDWVRRIVNILSAAKIPARVIHVLKLRDGMRHGALTPWLQIHDGKEWLVFNPKTGEAGIPPDTILWYVGDFPVFTLEGGKSANIQFSVSKHAREMTVVAEQRARQMGSRLMEFSLFSLPVEVQNVYRVLLLVPIGAFLIVVLRNVVGIKTFGTFMPILIALAFRETKLLWGVLLFSLLVGLGLTIRFYLEYLKLLLVPRLAAVLIIVILLMTSISLISHKLGMEQGLSVALFPMVILAMTIERMSLVWEEHGPAEALQQGLGSLLVAVLGYVLMSSKMLGHLTFAFPELLLLVLAATLLLGRYTGYRLIELWRFRSALRG